jgi:PHD/YefM family antitoxin component YafN of YafNO toxin-antitoxin module
MVEMTLESTYDTLPLGSLPTGLVELLRQLKSTGRPIAISVDGKVEAILQSVDEYQHHLELAQHDQAEEDAALREAEEDILAGRTRPVDEVFDEILRRYAVSR